MLPFNWNSIQTKMILSMIHSLGLLSLSRLDKVSVSRGTVWTATPASADDEVQMWEPL